MAGHKITSIDRHGNNIHCETCGRKVEWFESQGRYLHVENVFVAAPEISAFEAAQALLAQAPRRVLNPKTGRMVTVRKAR